MSARGTLATAFCRHHLTGHFELLCCHLLAILLSPAAQACCFLWFVLLLFPGHRYLPPCPTARPTARALLYDYGACKTQVQNLQCAAAGDSDVHACNSSGRRWRVATGRLPCRHRPALCRSRLLLLRLLCCLVLLAPLHDGLLCEPDELLVVRLQPIGQKLSSSKISHIEYS